MITRNTGATAFVLILAMLILGIWAKAQLPDTARIAVHFDAAGRPNGWMAPWAGLFILPAIAAGVCLVLAFVPRLDPRRANLVRSKSALGPLVLSPIVIIAIAQMEIVATALGIDLNVSRLTYAAMGGSFIVIGNVLGKLRWNYTAGIRTRWTLADERVWDKTHRFGGVVFVAGGALMLTAALILPAGSGLAAVIVAIGLGAALLTVLKSYLLSRDRQREGR
jgi:uncharacterized membrane protein